MEDGNYCHFMCLIFRVQFSRFSYCIVPYVFFSGFKGKDCSVDLDLCAFGMCSEHTLICVEAKDGQNVSCTCERGNKTLIKSLILQEYGALS